MKTANLSARAFLDTAASQGRAVVFCPELRSQASAALLMGAFASVLEARPAALCVTGCAQTRGAVAELAAARNLTDAVYCPADPANHQLQALYAECGLVVLTEAAGEENGLDLPGAAMLQAFNHGKRVVAPDIGPGARALAALPAGVCYAAGDRAALAGAMLAELGNLVPRGSA